MSRNRTRSRILDIILFVSMGIPLLFLFGIFLPTTGLLATSPTIEVDTIGLTLLGACGIIVSLAFFMPGLEFLYERYLAPLVQDDPDSSNSDDQVPEIDEFQS